MKRLLCILDSLDTGGAETFLMKIYRALDHSRYQIDFVVCKDGLYDNEVLENGGKIYHIPLRTKAFFHSFQTLKRIVRDNSYTSVLKLGSSPIVVTDLVAAKLGGAKKICLRSCNAPSRISRKQKMIDSVLRPMMNHLATVKIAPSDLAAEYTFGKKEVHAGNVRFLHNAVDLGYYQYDSNGAKKIEEEFNLQNKLVIGHIGRFNQQKNHDFLIDVFLKITEIKENAVLLLVGVGELEDAVQNKVKRIGIEDKVIFAGRRVDIPQLLSAMDVMVFPSFYEGMPNTVIEAQATGLPCLISDAITKEADVTGTIRYLPLSAGSAKWAELAAQMQIEETRRKENDCTAKKKMREKGYAIESSVNAFLSLCY